MSGARPDVLVVGAGPAGSAVAWRLARRGVRVRLLDARAFPRSKPCGDAVSAGATPFLRAMGVAERLERVPSARIGRWRLRARNGTWFEGRLRERAGADGPPWGYALPRRELDRLLLETAVEAGAEFLPRRRVFDLAEPHGDGSGAAGTGDDGLGVRARGPGGAEERHSAAVVVGADGLRSRMGRLLGGVRRGRRRRLAVVGRMAGDPGPEDAGELRFSDEGVLGLAPTGHGRCTVAPVVPIRRAPEISADPEGFFRARLGAYGLQDRLGTASLTRPLEVTGPFEVEPRRRTAPGVLLVGDAAGYFDPLTGQGIYRALAGARLAAEAVEDLLERPERDARIRRRYERRLDALIAPGRRLQRIIDCAVGHRALLAPLARVLAARPGLCDLLIEATGDRLPPGALLSPRRLGRSLVRANAPPGRPPRRPNRPAPVTEDVR